MPLSACPAFPAWRRGYFPARPVESMAANLEAIMEDASNDVHWFNTASGLILHRDVHNRPTVASLSCIARSMGVPCHIKEEKEDNDATSE
ncbi:hypothetical protein CHLRE_13g585175v5 [Chlamydomonas reinhardtii]|uniref:Uncharacterized protein n=1 Tax=Chlamydomonas reinhardtii TaxID=3055 RepID=A0A2K3D0S2_CHLRE|nr:uncharacterized protein CHLRE_13g585175v5 [Chlamydomonas reinhardtii]PNW74099.1 hypothetical protein CHLRE_13g585175v5 [Chlamydomonas reinhardtii]